MDKTDIIDFTELPKEVLDQIPYSIKTKKTKYVVNELPLEIQYLLDKYFNNKLPTITYEDALDFKFDISKYSDLGIYSDTFELLENYLSNYLLTRLKSYPYDVEFGCALKDQLMMLDTSLRQTYIANEIKMVAATLSSDLNLNIQITNFSINKNEGTTSTEYSCSIELTVNGNLSKIEVTSSVD